MRNACYYAAQKAIQGVGGKQVSFSDRFIASVRAAWPYPDDKLKPPEPLTELEEEAYFDDHTPNEEEAADFVRALFTTSGLEVPEHLRSTA
jgi:hypothetical protein